MNPKARNQATADDSRAYLRPRQVAAICNVHLATVIRWITVGVRGVKLSATMMGGGWRITQVDVDAFTAECTHAATYHPSAQPAKRGRPISADADHEADLAKLRELGIL